MFRTQQLTRAVAASLIAMSPALAHVAPVPCDFTTGGGFVITDDGAHANFGLVAGCKNGDFFGHVNFVDHDIAGLFAGFHLSSIKITGYFDSCPGGGCPPGGSNYRDICGTANSNLFGPLHFRVRTHDGGEPGAGVDRFGLEVQSDTYDARAVVVQTRYLEGGNIQLHKPNPSTTGPNPYPTEEEGCPGTTPSMLDY